MFINIETQQKEQSFVIFINQAPTIYQNISNLSNCLESNHCIDGNRCNHKNQHPRHNLPQTFGDANTYVRFGYVPLTICNHTQGQVSG